METVDQAITRLRGVLETLEWLAATPGTSDVTLFMLNSQIDYANRELERMLRVKAQGLQYEPDF